ncbi:MAG: DUF4411 family protein [Acidobacteria bacterium]|nr:DUF4411 family protein [Acidobacteriota bacterium]
MADDTYCIDTSSLIQLNRFYKPSVFPGVWVKIEELVKQGRLIAPDAVKSEIEKGDDELIPWAKNHRRMFRKLSQEQMDAAKEIVALFPKLAKPEKFGEEADSFVVALARLENQRTSSSLLQQQSRCVVVTEERGAEKIPGACRRYNLTCVTLVDLFDREGWKF